MAVLGLRFGGIINSWVLKKIFFVGLSLCGGKEGIVSRFRVFIGFRWLWALLGFFLFVFWLEIKAKRRERL